MILHGKYITIYHNNIYLATLIVREDLSKLSYTTMCIKESLRLYSPVPYIAKELSEDFEFYMLKETQYLKVYMQ